MVLRVSGLQGFGFAGEAFQNKGKNRLGRKEVLRHIDSCNGCHISGIIGKVALVLAQCKGHGTP